jgi:predicted Zn-dependent peptidase
MFKKYILENGLKIITIPDKNTQAVTVLVLVKTGSKYEKKEKNGISHFLEHMFFKGTKKRPSLYEVAGTLDKVGGIYNAFTSEDFTGFFAKVDSSHFDLALDWISDILLNPLFPEKEIEKERGVIIEEINMYYDNPMNYVQILWPQLLYGDQPAGWPIAGTKESVSKISREDLIDYFKTHYLSKNTIICLSGNFKEREGIEKVKRYFSKIKVGEPAKKPPVLENQKKPNLLFHFRETEQTHFCLGTRAYNLFHPKKYALEVLGVILGGMFSSRLSVIFRDKLGIAYYIHSEVESNPDTGFLVTIAGVDAKNFEKAIKIVLKEYKRISEEKVPQKELKKAKDYLKGKLALSLETSDAKASFYGIQEILKGEILTPEQIFQKIEKVNQKEIQKVAKDIFRPEKLNLAFIGPFKESKKFEKFLKI